jgi:hypothetical protein
MNVDEIITMDKLVMDFNPRHVCVMQACKIMLSSSHYNVLLKGELLIILPL